MKKVGELKHELKSSTYPRGGGFDTPPVIVFLDGVEFFQMINEMRAEEQAKKKLKSV